MTRLPALTILLLAAAAGAQTAPPGQLTVTEFRHPQFDHYFITAYPDEAASLAAGNLPPWTPTGKTFKAWSGPGTNITNVCRFFSATFAPRSSHFYSGNAVECPALTAGGVWTLEAPNAFYMMPSATGACPSGTMPLFRLYNSGMSGAPNHRYTIHRSARAAMLAAGWIAEGNGVDGVFACVPRAAGVPYLTPNTYPTGVVDGYTVTDAARNRSFSIRVRFPVGAPLPLPLVLWSHGGGANASGHLTHEEWGTRFASAGYAVIHIAHAPALPDSHCVPLGIPGAECTAAAIAAGSTLEAIWYHRPRDASAVLNDLAAIATATGLQFDLARIAIAGHSGGCHTVMQTAGAAIDFSASARGKTYAEPRIKAFLANSPQGIGILGMAATSWNAIRRPVMTTTGANDVAGLTDDPTLRLHPFQSMPPPDKFQLYLDSAGATHKVFGLNEVDGTGDRPLTQLEEYVWSSGIAFIDAYTRNLPAAQTWLRAGEIEAWSAGVGEISWK